MRVRELAKELNVSSKELLAELKRMRLPVKNHMSQVEDREVERIKAIYERRRAREEEEEKNKETPVETGENPETGAGESKKTRKKPVPNLAGNILKRKAPITDKAKLEAIEKAKAAREAREAEHKEKRSHRPPPPQVARLLKKKGARPAMAAKKSPPVEEAPAKTHEKKPEVAPPVTGEKKKTAAKKTEKSKKKKKDKKTGDIIVPTIEVMSFKELKKDIAERWKKRSKGKKGARKKDQKEVKKGKKIKPSFYVDLEKKHPSSKKAKVARKKAAGKKKVSSVTIHGDITVMEFADKIKMSVLDVVARLLEIGENFAPAQILPPEYCELLCDEMDIDLEIVPEKDEYDIQEFVIDDNPEKMQPRPPVITIMGHVDHGKTTLLDSIRKSDIVSKEYGGITQHIGAYCIKTEQGDLVFLDTPGHEAFTAMRARGAEVTDIVILVVAADDGVMPQTAEAINHSKAADVPIIVAVNKIDKPGANPAKVKQELMKYELVPEEFGGETLFSEVAARTGENVEKLLELIHLQSEILELKADANRNAEGAILESHMDPLRGVIATVLVKKGTLHSSDVILSGEQWGRVRVMVDDHGQQLEEAGPSQPVEVIGFQGVPSVGEPFMVIPDEKEARRIAEIRHNRRRRRGLGKSQQHVTLENLQSYMREADTKELNIILKGDVQGSLEAVSQSLEKLSTEKVKISTIHSAVGAITESDINLADASDAIVIGFNVRPEASAMELAQEQGVEIKVYQIIYELLDEVKLAMQGMLEPKFKEVTRGRAEVRQIFKISRIGNIAGCFVESGEIHASDKARLIRDGRVIYNGEIASLRRVKDDVKTVQQTQECGISLERFKDVKEGDIIETYYMEEIPQEL